MAIRETIHITTPLGHEVRALIDYDSYELADAKVVHTHTGVIRPLDKKTKNNLARALKARQVYEHALQETATVEQTLHGFGKLAEALGNKHPALQPYWQEAAQHRHIAEDMKRQARLFHKAAMEAIEKIAEE